MGQAGTLEILVQDDCSPDVDPREFLGGVFNCVRNEKNLGFAGNCNAGAARAKGEILLFLNQDTKARPGWIEPLLETFDNPRVGIAGPKLVIDKPVVSDGYDTLRMPYEVIQSCGGLYDAGKGPYHRYLGYSADYWAVNKLEKVSWTTGAALAIRRDVFFKVGGFDIGYERGYFEDCALCEDVKALSYEIWYQPKSVFEHTVGSTGGVPPHVFKANSMRFHYKWDNFIVPDTNVIHVNY